MSYRAWRREISYIVNLVQDRRATNAALTSNGWAKVVATAPGHVATVRQDVIDPLTATDVADLDRIMGRILGALDPSNQMRVTNPTQ